MVWNPDPTLVDSGFFELRWYGLLFTLGIAISYTLVQRAFRQANLPDALFDKFAVTIVVSMFVGMRLGHFLFYEPQALIERPLEVLLPISFSPSFQFIGYQGLASHGGIIGMLLGTVWWVRKHPSVSWWWIVNQLALVGSLAGGFIRLGNLMNSEIIGKVTDVPWAFVFTSVDALPRHPTQLYEATGYFMIFGLLYWQKRRKLFRHPHRSLGWFLILLFSWRFIVEFFKIGQVAFEDGLWLNMGQWLSVPFVVVGMVLLLLPTRVVQK